MAKQTVVNFFKSFPDDAACLAHLFEARYGKDHACKKCGTVGRWYPLQNVRAYSCGGCGDHLHPTVGTPFEKSRTSLQLWFYAIFMFVQSRNGVSAKELQRSLGVTYKTAWRMGHEIRKHMDLVDGEGILGGPGEVVEVDETFVGGHTPGGQGGKGKAVVFGMLEREGQVMTKVVEGRKAHQLLPHVVENVAPGTEIHTDDHRAYSDLKYVDQYEHKVVNHSAKEYVGTQGQTTNAIEGYFSQLKRTISGTHIHVSPKHLDKYAKECEYRYNRRARPETMLPELLSTFPKKEM